MYQLLVFVLQPPFLLYVAVALALANLWRKRQESRRRLLLLTVPFLLLAILSIPAVGYLAQGGLEWSYRPRTDLPEDTQAVVVLSGYAMGPDSVRTQAELGPDTLYRCLHALDLYDKSGPRPILVTGGVPDGRPDKPALADVMRDFLVQKGVRAEDVIVENRSTSTYENAVESSKLLRERGYQRIVLITDAEHMYRAKLCFEKQGMHVTPAPCNFQASRLELKPENFLPSPGGSGRFERAFHEYLGIVYYWLRGRI